MVPWPLGTRSQSGTAAQELGGTFAGVDGPRSTALSVLSRLAATPFFAEAGTVLSAAAGSSIPQRWMPPGRSRLFLRNIRGGIPAGEYANDLRHFVLTVQRPQCAPTEKKGQAAGC